MRYQVIVLWGDDGFTSLLNELEEQVGLALAEGWRPQGGVSMTTIEDRYWVAQAVVRDMP